MDEDWKREFYRGARQIDISPGVTLHKTTSNGYLLCLTLDSVEHIFFISFQQYEYSVVVTSPLSTPMFAYFYSCVLVLVNVVR